VARSKLKEWLAMQSMLRSVRPGEKEIINRPRRRKLYLNKEEDHHSIWKLAYADFMTAMMTFFLAMWLINYAAKERIVQLANYFNPVKLNDPAPYIPGLRDMERRHTGREFIPVPQPIIFHGRHNRRHAAVAAAQEEEAFLQNPFPMLSVLASQADPAIAAAVEKTPDAFTGHGASRDPFLTDYFLRPAVNWITSAWRYEFGTGTATQAGQASSSKGGADGKPPSAVPLSKGAAAPASQVRKSAYLKTEPASAEAQKKLEIQKRAKRLERDVLQLVSTLPKTSGPEVTVKAVIEGVLISLSDGTGFNMFKIGSAVPSPPLVIFLERLGRIINRYPGGIVVNGHTDARRYAGDGFGNWRLSVNRATMTYYMLMRGKVGDSRFLALKGYAERNLKNKADPLSPENRRIEILIRLPEAA
jgi:chemotaxis protein MotB